MYLQVLVLLCILMHIEFTVEFIDRCTSIGAMLQPVGDGGYDVKRPTLTDIPGDRSRPSTQKPRRNTDATKPEVHLK